VLKSFAYITFFCFAGILYSSCKQDTLAPVDVGYAYYPSNIGHWILYDVDSTYYDGFTHTVRNYTFKINEKVESSFYDNQNRLTQRLERYKQLSDSTSWFLKDVWISNITSTTAEKVEENIRFIKLVFPINSSQIWDGNALNSEGSMDYEYDNLFQPYTVNGVTYDSTVTVIENVDSNLISVKYMIEVYAKNVGLIFRRYKDVQKMPDPLHDSITSGIDYTYRIRSFGN
jgi:hypothetical protein